MIWKPPNTGDASNAFPDSPLRSYCVNREINLQTIFPSGVEKAYIVMSSEEEHIEDC